MKILDDDETTLVEAYDYDGSMDLFIWRLPEWQKIELDFHILFTLEL